MRSLACGLVCCVLLHICGPELAAQSLGKDVDDAVSVSLFGQSLGLVSTNLTDKKITFSLTRDGLRREQSFNISISAKAQNDLGTILSGGSLTAESNIKARYAWRINQGPSTDAEREECLEAVRSRYRDTVDPRYRDGLDRCNKVFDHRIGASWGRWIFVESGVTGASYSLLDRAADFADQVTDTSFAGASFGLGLNQWAVRKGDVFVFGAAVVWDERNAIQSEDLSRSTVHTVREISTDTSGIVREELGSATTVYSGDYEEYDRVNVNADLFWVPRGWSNVGLWFLNRWSMMEDRRPRIEPGAGLFLFKGDNPLEPIGSVAVERHQHDWTLSVHGSLTLFR